VRIVHTCLRYPPASGGVETYVQQLVERVRREQDHDVRVLTSKLRTHVPASLLSANQLNTDPPYVQRLLHAATPGLAYPRLQSLSHYLSHHAPDILHGYSFWYQPADVAARYSQRSHIPFIFHPMYYTNRIRHKLHWQLYKKSVGHKTFSLADAVVVISPYEQQLIAEEGFKVKRFSLIPPGIDISELSRSYPSPYIARKITGPILLCVSRLASGKGLSDIITALPRLIKKYPSLNLAIVGDDFGQKNNLTKLSMKLGVQQHTHFLGQLDRPSLIGAYQHADVFVHPSLYEAFGIVVAEALACRTPVVARHTSAIPYVAPHNKAALLFNNQSEMISHISSLLNNQSQSNTLADHGFTHIKNNFTWENSIKKLTNLYQDLS